MSKIFFGIICLLFLSVTCFFMNLLIFDANDLYYAQKTMHLLLEIKDTNFMDISWPIMERFYVGSMRIYLHMIIFSIFKPSLLNIKIMSILIPLAYLICVFYVISRWSNVLVGLLTIFLLVCNSSFVDAIRGEIADEIIINFLFWLGILLLSFWREKYNKIYLCLAGFIFGFALWVKLLFGIYMLAAAIMYCFSEYRTYLNVRFFRRINNFWIFISMFFLGSMPLLIYYFNNFISDTAEIVICQINNSGNVVLSKDYVLDSIIVF